MSHPDPVLWCAIYDATDKRVRDIYTWPMSSRQRSDWMLRELCRACRDILDHPVFWPYFHSSKDPTHTVTGELCLITVLANTPAEQVVQWVREGFADDPYPVDRLNPFLSVKANGQGLQ